ncbi:hypothetical protein FHG87_021299 [Trinorchestia longiramus]|nr:hypothetical protein FHG87_021299 [Trinorchestia longiramus]
MNLRNKLMEIDNNILALSMEFERQNQVVQEWEAERLRSSGKPTSKSSNGEITIDMDKDKDDDDSDDEPDEVSQAWEDLVYLQKEQQRYADMREKVEQEMVACKTKGQQLEERRENLRVKNRVLWYALLRRLCVLWRAYQKVTLKPAVLKPFLLNSAVFVTSCATVFTS